MMREMKNSGVEWIGDIPSEWKLEKNKHCFELTKNIVGGNFSSYELLSLTKKGIVIKDVNNSFGKVPESYETYQSVKKGQLVLCLFDLDCSAVFSGLSNHNGMISPAYKVYDCKNNIDKKYVAYWFDYCFDGRKYKIYSKSLRYVVNADDFGDIEIILPTFHEQKRIADFLDSKVTEIDKIISETKASIENYKEYKQSIITEAVTKGLDKNVPMKDSGIEWIGKIPCEWKVCKLRYLVDKIGDVDHCMPESTYEGYPYIMTGDLKPTVSIIDFDKCKKISKYDYDLLSEKIKPEIGDVILARYATIGTVSYVDVSKEFLVSYSCVTIKSNNDLKGKYLFYYIKSKTFEEEIKKYINANTQGNVGTDSLYRVKVSLPCISEQQRIIDYLDNKCAEIDNLIAEKEKLITNLEEYKKSLIYEYVTGKKTI